MSKTLLEESKLEIVSLKYKLKESNSKLASIELLLLGYFAVNSNRTAPDVIREIKNILGDWYGVYR